MNEVPPQPPEHLVYARLLDHGTRLGFAALVLAFAAYVFGIVEPQVPVQRLTELWQYPVDRYLALTGTPTGWGWLALLRHADVAALVGIAVLCGCSLPALLALVPLYWKRGDKALALFCIAEVVVVLLAASGLAGR